MYKQDINQNGCGRENKYCESNFVSLKNLSFSTEICQS
jgi:hypothetical protein